MTKHIFKSLFITVGAVLTFSAGQGLAQDWIQYAQIGGWTINQYVTSEAAGNAPSCSATRFDDHINALRIERVAEGHLIGFNGMNRKYDGQSFDVEFWFDGHQSESWNNTAIFAKDAAYPDDDWLSLGHPLNERPTFAKAFSGRNSFSFDVTIPGNNRPVIVTHPLENITQVLASLDQCYLAAINVPLSSQHVTSDCPDDGPRLPGTGICQGRAFNYLTATNPENALMQGCEWTVNETRLPGGDYLLYQAAKCGPHTATLELAGGAHSAVLSISKSAISGGTPSWNVAKVFGLNGADPKDEIMMRAGQFMSDPSEAAKCMARRPRAELGFPADAYVVDYKPEYQHLLGEDEQHWVCGDLGLNDHNIGFWRVFGGFAWFIEMGQDAWWEFDPASMTVLTAAELQGR